MPTTTTTECPGSYEELAAWYRPWVEGLVRKSGVPDQDVADVASDILEAEFKAGVIEMYNPDHVAEHQGKQVRVTFRAFLSSRVMLRCRGKRETLSRRAYRELLLCDTTDSSGTRWVELFGGACIDEYDLDDGDFLDRMRSFLASTPRPDPDDAPDLLTLFDELLTQVDEDGAVSMPRLRKRFGLSDARATAAMTRLRQVISGVGELPPVQERRISDIILTLPEVQDAISRLEGSSSIMVAKPLEGHPLALAADMADAKGRKVRWYHKIAEDELALFPELAIDPQTHKKPAGHCKIAVLHCLHRMLSAGIQELVPAQALPEDDSPVTVLDLIEAKVWSIGGNAQDVQEVIDLACALRDGTMVVA